jgi:hypothetical protein
MTRFCGNCGTEVDETAAFCPTCGQPLDEAAEVEMPPAPAWPERPAAPEPPPTAAEPPGPVTTPSSEWSRPAAPSTPGPPPPQQAPEPGQQPERSWVAGDPTQPTAAPYGTPPQGSAAPPPPGSTAPPPPGPAGSQHPPSPTIDLPITWPVTLSAWLIGGGALVGALGALIGLFSPALNAWDVILLLLLGAIAVTVFFSASIPAIPHLRLATLVIVLIATGIALDRIGYGFVGIGTVLLLFGAAAAAIGAVILELGRDQPLGGPRA